MFDIGWGELLIIGIVALVVIGPKELPGVIRGVGQMMAKVRRMAADFQGQFQEAMREAEVADLKQDVDSLRDSVSGLRSIANPLDSLRTEVRQAIEKAGSLPDPVGPPATPPVAAPPVDLPPPEPAPPVDLSAFRAPAEPPSAAAPEPAATAGAKPA